MKRFEGTDTYIATDDLMMAVNAALTLERPPLQPKARQRLRSRAEEMQ